MTTTNDAGTLREKIIGLVIDVYQSGYYFGSIGERDARNPYTTPEDTAREILAAVAEAMLSDEVISSAHDAHMYGLEARGIIRSALNAAGIIKRKE